MTDLERFIEAADARRPSVNDVNLAVETLEEYILEEAHEACHDSCFDWIALHLSAFACENLTKEIVRALCRGLTDRGLMRYERGLFNEDGEPAGSGYRITEKGREALQQRRAAREAITKGTPPAFATSA